jgi:hypothetical protein
MKSFLLLIAVVCAVLLTSNSTPFVSNAADVAGKQSATMRFDKPVKLIDVTLKGEYLFVHDDAAMARGDACSFVYKGLRESPANLVVSFHCTPANRGKVEHFTVRMLQTSPTEFELREFQFGGSTEAHLVPVHQPGEHVTVVH